MFKALRRLFPAPSWFIDLDLDFGCPSRQPSLSTNQPTALWLSRLGQTYSPPARIIKELSMKQFMVGTIGVIAGCGVGLASTSLCMALGLQSSNWKTLITINMLTGIGGAIAGLTIARDTQTDAVPKAQLDRAIGKLNGRYELQSLGEDKLAILKELQEELNSH